MDDCLTRVEIVYLRDWINYWIRFGVPIIERTQDRRRGVAYFPPGQLVGYVRWEGGQYGTARWRLVVVETGQPGHRMQAVPGIRPGGHTLLDARGATFVKRALRAIQNVEDRGLDPTSLPASHFTNLHSRLTMRLPIRPPTARRIAAYARARDVRTCLRDDN